MSSAAKTFLAGLAVALLTDESKVLQPVIDNYTNSLIADPSITNAATQSIVFQTQVAALVPQAGSTAIKDTAVAIKAFVDTQLPALVAQVAAELQDAAGTQIAATADVQVATAGTTDVNAAASGHQG